MPKGEGGKDGMVVMGTKDVVWKTENCSNPFDLRERRTSPLLIGKPGENQNLSQMIARQQRRIGLPKQICSRSCNLPVARMFNAVSRTQIDEDPEERLAGGIGKKESQTAENNVGYRSACKTREE
jgi:hypothetical protein